MAVNPGGVAWLLGQVGFAVGLAGAAFVIGRRLIARLPACSTAEEAAFATALGLGVVSHLLFALGLLGQLSRAPVLVALVGLTVACALTWRPVRWPRFTWASVGLAGACVLVAALALYPSTAWDANSYHLPSAAWFVERHRVSPAWSLRYPAFPQAHELLFALALLVGDQECAQLVQAIFCAIVALALYAAGRRRSVRAGAWAAALWLGSPLVLRLGSVAYIDVGLTAYGTLSVLALDRWRCDRQRGWLVLASAFAGFAASSKYLGLFFVAVVGVMVLAGLLRQRATWRDLLAASAVSLATGAPWYVYVGWETGNPVFPFLGGVLGFGPWSAADLAAQMNEMRSHGIGRSLLAALTLPFRLAFLQRPFFPEVPVSPFPWVGLLPAAWVARRDPQLRRWVLIVVGYVACWFLGIQIYRYLLPALPLLALAGGVATAELIPTRRRWLAPVVAGLLIAFSAQWALTELWHRGAPPTTEEARAAWLAARMPAHRAVRFAASAAAGARLYQLELDEYVVCAGPDVVGDWFGPWRYARLLDRVHDADAFVTELAATGARWLVARADIPVPAHPRLPKRYADESAAVYQLLP
jgi:hypothetical protein